MKIMTFSLDFIKSTAYDKLFKMFSKEGFFLIRKGFYAPVPDVP
jgi:hypothetical protein